VLEAEWFGQAHDYAVGNSSKQSEEHGQDRFDGGTDPRDMFLGAWAVQWKNTKGMACAGSRYVLFCIIICSLCTIEYQDCN
jgi:hypothetical protein